jgi:hypothetical protein
MLLPRRQVLLGSGTVHGIKSIIKHQYALDYVS